MDRLDTLLQFYEDEPGDAFTCYALAQEYLKRGEVQEALAFFEALVEDHPEHTGTYYHLGKLYERLGRTEDAIATYQKGIEAAQQARARKDLSELQDALLKAQGVGFEDE